MSADATGPAIYLLDDRAAELRDEIARYFPAAPPLHVGKPSDASGVVLIGSAIPLAAGTLHAARGVLLLAPALAERDRVQLALAGWEHVWLEVLPDPAGEIEAERALGLLLRLASQGHGMTVSGSTVGLLGYRALGWKLAALLRELGATARYWSPASGRRAFEEERKQQLAASAQPAAFDELLHVSDALVIDLPDEPGSAPLIGRAELALMRDEAVLINTTSATALDDGALIQALRGGYLGGVGLARTNLEPLPPDSPLQVFERVLLAPELASVDTGLARRLLAERIARALARRPELHLEARRVRHVARRRRCPSARDGVEPKGEE